MGRAPREGQDHIGAGGASGTPDLELVDRTTAIGERHLGRLCTLLVWHEEDPVEDAERRRNDVIFPRQGNRNPFVDHPRVGSEHLDKCLSIGGRL